MTDLFPSAQFHLHLLKFLCWDDRFMVSFHIILLNFAVIDFMLFGQEVNGEGLLQKGVTPVFFVGQDIGHS